MSSELVADPIGSESGRKGALISFPSGGVGMFCYSEQIKKTDMGEGVIRQYLGEGTSLNAQHWNMADRSVVKLHSHPQEQFGYVIRGGFRMIIGDETADLKAGDAYFIPPNVPHEFTAVGETEAIDVFSPAKTDFPWKE
jgi:quercetin dioxygenase-like cupin family protein